MIQYFSTILFAAKITSFLEFVFVVCLISSLGSIGLWYLFKRRMAKNLEILNTSEKLKNGINYIVRFLIIIISVSVSSTIVGGFYNMTTQVRNTLDLLVSLSAIFGSVGVGFAGLTFVIQYEQSNRELTDALFMEYKQQYLKVYKSINADMSDFSKRNPRTLFDDNRLDFDGKNFFESFDSLSNARTIDVFWFVMGCQLRQIAGYCNSSSEMQISKDEEQEKISKGIDWLTIYMGQISFILKDMRILTTHLQEMRFLLGESETSIGSNKRRLWLMYMEINRVDSLHALYDSFVDCIEPFSQLESYFKYQNVPINLSWIYFSKTMNEFVMFRDAVLALKK